MTRVERRAARLVRCYPPAWRERYGEEFSALLADDLAERPRAVARTLDVLRCAVIARATCAGLAGEPTDAADHVRSSLAALACCVAAFLAFGVSLWSQMAIGWQWSEPDTPTISLAMHIMSIALLVLVVLAVAAAVPIALTAVRALFTPAGVRRFAVPLALVTLGAAVLVVGSHDFARGWPGTGGHPWSSKGLVPADVASTLWASTLSITAYWMHPGELAAFPAAEIRWMAIAPVAMFCLVAGAAKTIRRVEVSPALLRYETRVGVAAGYAMLAFLGGAACWLLQGSAGPRNLFPLGVIHVIDITAMALTLAAALGVARRAQRVGAQIT